MFGIRWQFFFGIRKMRGVSSHIDIRPYSNSIAKTTESELPGMSLNSPE